MVRTGRGSGPDVRKQEMLYVNIAAYSYIINNVNNVPIGQILLEMEMEIEFYVNTDMHVYVYVRVHGDSRDLEAGACFCSSFLSWYVRKPVCLIHI